MSDDWDSLTPAEKAHYERRARMAYQKAYFERRKKRDFVHPFAGMIKKYSWVAKRETDD